MFYKVVTKSGVLIAIASATAHVGAHFSAEAEEKISITHRHPTAKECAEFDWSTALESVFPAGATETMPIVVETMDKVSGDISAVLVHFESESAIKKFIASKMNDFAGIEISEMKDIEAMKFMQEHSIAFTDVVEIAAPVKPEGGSKRGRKSNAEKAAMAAAAQGANTTDESGASIPTM